MRRHARDYRILASHSVQSLLFCRITRSRSVCVIASCCSVNVTRWPIAKRVKLDVARKTARNLQPVSQQPKAFQNDVALRCLLQTPLISCPQPKLLANPLPLPSGVTTIYVITFSTHDSTMNADSQFQEGFLIVTPPVASSTLKQRPTLQRPYVSNYRNISDSQDMDSQNRQVGSR
ncbi:hypothetical protein T02_10118 [Trichinella nativa]|uniref:Uncharacterized protein n=1 Tax=Trichinella nativa TaxID=6335 RepID=A0A0V1L8Q8_9BILA|nr:hypothetical protein T02_10118 [Trichinella nativa]